MTNIANLNQLFNQCQCPVISSDYFIFWHIMPTGFYSRFHTPHINHRVCCKNIIATYKITFFFWLFKGDGG